MITKRIIACLDVHDGRVVKGVQFVDLIDAGDPATQAARHAREGADEIVLLDITATHEGRQTLLDTVRRTAHELFVPFCVGGGIRTADDAAQVFEAGADKVSVNSAALKNPQLIDDIGRSFGAQAVVVAIDARRDPNAADPVRDAQVFVQGGRKLAGRRVVEWAREAEQRGAGEILLTSMNSDGMRTGFDCELTAAVSELSAFPSSLRAAQEPSSILSMSSVAARPMRLSRQASFTSAYRARVRSKKSWPRPASP
jgi:cyclase